MILGLMPVDLVPHGFTLRYTIVMNDIVTPEGEVDSYYESVNLTVRHPQFDDYYFVLRKKKWIIDVDRMPPMSFEELKQTIRAAAAEARVHQMYPLAHQLISALKRTPG